MTDNPILAELRQAVVDGDDAAAADRARAALAAGIEPNAVLNEALMKGADEVGKKFEDGEYFLPELMLTGRALKAAMEVVKPEIQKHLAPGASLAGGKILMATIQTDIHDLGKNMVASMLLAAGFDVTDLGVDVPLKTIIDKAEESGARVIALSALLTTSMPYMRDLIQMLRDRHLRDKYLVLVGGASVTPAWAKDIGADGTAENAMEAVRLTRSLLSQP